MAHRPHAQIGNQMDTDDDWFEIEGHVDPSRHLTGMDVLFGTGRIRELERRFARRGWDRALLVCGPHVAGNRPLLAAIREAIGRPTCEVYEGASPDKPLASVYAGIDRMRECGADVLVGVGSGSSIDTARQMSAFGADGRPAEAFIAAARRGEIVKPRLQPAELPVILLPTTLAGGAVSTSGSIEVLPAEQTPDGQPIRTFGHVTADAVIHDPNLFSTTPKAALCGSAMNGINKAIEALYGRSATPLTDAYATQALRLIAPTVAGLRHGDQRSLASVSAGVLLAQLRRSSSIMHAFGHAVARRSSIQQGIIHGIVAPHALRYLYRRATARREVLGDALGIARQGRSVAALGDAILAEVTRIRDSLGVPTRWSDVTEPIALDLAAVADYACREPLMANAPLERPMTQADALSVLQAAA